MSGSTLGHLRRNAASIVSAVSARRHGISLRDLAGLCEIDQATVKRTVKVLKTEFGAPISSDRRGYHWRPAPHEKRLAEALIIVFCGNQP